MKQRLAALLSVKSIVTIILTLVYAWAVIAGKATQELMVIYTTVIAFYFGTQHQKTKDDLS